MEGIVEKHLDYLIQRYPVLQLCKQEIKQAFLLLKETYDQEGKLLVCGNGGSAADSEHIVGELMKEFALRRPICPEEKKRLKEICPEQGEYLGRHLQGALPAIALTGSPSLSSAYANDAVPELVFAQQVYGQSTLLGISTSGNAKNVIYALKVAKLKGMKTIGLTGESGGNMKALCDVCICVPSKVTPDIQEMHLPVYHTLCRMLEEVYFG